MHVTHAKPEAILSFEVEFPAEVDGQQPSTHPSIHHVPATLLCHPETCSLWYNIFGSSSATSPWSANLLLSLVLNRSLSLRLLDSNNNKCYIVACGTDLRLAPGNNKYTRCAGIYRSRVAQMGSFHLVVVDGREISSTLYGLFALILASYLLFRQIRSFLSMKGALLLLTGALCGLALGR